MLNLKSYFPVAFIRVKGSENSRFIYIHINSEFTFFFFFSNSTLTAVSEIYWRPPENLLMVRRQLLVQPHQFAMVVLYSRELIFSIGSMVVILFCHNALWQLKQRRKRP